MPTALDNGRRSPRKLQSPGDVGGADVIFSREQLVEMFHDVIEEEVTKRDA
jgi:hypothetical protein